MCCLEVSLSTYLLLHMKIYRKEWELVVPSTIEEVWAFFSRPENLQKMMPADMSFEILTDIAGVEMYEGMMIQYRVAPVLQIPLEWTTEITIIKHSTRIGLNHPWLIFLIIPMTTAVITMSMNTNLTG